MSVGIEQLWFELQRRVPLFKQGTTMPGGGLLGYDGDPNLTDTSGTIGEALLYYSTQGTLFQQSNGTMWRKALMPNVWVEIGTGSGGGGGGTLNPGDDITFTGDIAFNGQNITIGDGSNSTIFITSELDGDLIPSLNKTYDLGSVSTKWQSLFVDDVHAKDTVTNKLYFTGHPGVDLTSNGQVSPDGTVSPDCTLTGAAEDVYSLDWEDVQDIKEAQTIVNCHSARWTNEHLSLIHI